MTSLFDIRLRVKPSQAFVGILAELNERFPDWTDGTYDWANQTVDFLRTPAELPQFEESLFQTPLSKRALTDVLNVSLAILAGNYQAVRAYLKQTHYAFVIGFPRSGGSYLVKELIRTLGVDHKRVSEALAHDGFPELSNIWFDWMGGRNYFYLQESIFQMAEFLVISHLYYRHKTGGSADGHWLVPKKMHKAIHWAGSLKMLLGRGAADYLVTVRHPAPTCVSVYEKSGGLPAGGCFPAKAPRSAIEHWILRDLMYQGYSSASLERIDYFDAVLLSWSQFYTTMATSGLFLGDRDEIRLIPYGKSALENVIAQYRARYRNDDAPEPVRIAESAKFPEDWLKKGDTAVGAVSAAWSVLGLKFPQLTTD